MATERPVVHAARDRDTSRREDHIRRGYARMRSGYSGHVDGIIRFYDDFGVIPICAEQQVYHPRLMYAGTFDLYAQCDHHQYAMIDFKSSGDERATALQLAGYTLDGLVGAPSDKPITTGMMVTLDGNGGYKVKVFDLRNWWPRWKAVLTVYSLKRVKV